MHYSENYRYHQLGHTPGTYLQVEIIVSPFVIALWARVSTFPATILLEVVVNGCGAAVRRLFR